MSVVDKALQHTPVGAPPLTVPEAIASLLVAAISVDGNVNPEEAVRMPIARSPVITDPTRVKLLQPYDFALPAGAFPFYCSLDVEGCRTMRGELIVR